METGGMTGIIGSGNVPWNEVFNPCQKQAGTEWYVVRLRPSQPDPLKSATEMMEALKGMGKA